MYLSEFWSKFGVDILISSIFIVACIILFVTLVINYGHKGTGKKKYLIGGAILVLVLVSINLIMIKDYKSNKVVNPEIVFPIAKVFLFNAFIIIAFVILGYFLTAKKVTVREKVSVLSIVILGLLMALASVLMLFGIPIMPQASYLKLEVSALIYFMVFLWFGTKPTIVIIFLTNIIHALMGSITSTPVIPGLDEMVNVVACLAYLLPSFIAFRKLPKNESPQFSKVVITSIIGVIFTTIFMVLYNQYINLPLIYNMPMDFKLVLSIFGPFNIIKWSAVSVVVILLYSRLYNLKDQITR